MEREDLCVVVNSQGVCVCVCEQAGFPSSLSVDFTAAQCRRVYVRMLPCTCKRTMQGTFSALCGLCWQPVNVEVKLKGGDVKIAVGQFAF